MSSDREGGGIGSLGKTRKISGIIEIYLQGGMSYMSVKLVKIHLIIPLRFVYLIVCTFHLKILKIKNILTPNITLSGKRLKVFLQDQKQVKMPSFAPPTQHSTRSLSKTNSARKNHKGHLN